MPKTLDPLKPKREPRKVPRLVIRGYSAMPGVSLMQRIALVPIPLPEDLAVLDAWQPTLTVRAA